MIKNCTQCGCEFNAHFKNQIVCSTKCSKNKQEVPNKFSCLSCEKDIYTFESHMKYCSPQCRGDGQTLKFREKQYRKMLDEELWDIVEKNRDYVMDPEFTDEKIEETFDLCNFDVEKQLDVKTYTGNLKRRY